MSKAPNLAGLLESFFTSRLVNQRNATTATIETYRHALRLLVLYVSDRTGRPPVDLITADLDREMVLAFLDHAERERGNGPRTRNARLTAIRSFFRHVAASDPGSLAIAQRVLAVPNKRTVTKAPKHLDVEQLEALLKAPDSQTTQGRRDHALLLFLARTGARVSEACGVDAADLRLERPHQVLLRGKGRKQRTIPLTVDLARTLETLCQERGLGRDERLPVFVGASGERLTRFGVTHIVRRAVQAGAARAPGLARAGASPHVLRHTLAMTLLQSGVDLVTIQAWLGHAQVATTHTYAEADVEMMRKGLQRAGITAGPSARFRPKDAVLRLLESR